MKLTPRFSLSIALTACITVIGASLPAIGVSAQATAVATPAVTVDASCTMAAADCTLLAEANANISQEQTFTLTISQFSLMLNGANPLNVTLKGSGPFTFDPTNAPLGFRTSLDLTTTDSRKTTNGVLSLVVANGNLYYKTSADWQAFSLTGQSGAATAATAGATLSATATTVPTLTATAVPGKPSLSTVDTDLATLLSQPGVVTLTRHTPDATIDSQSVAQFQYVIDLQKMLSSSGSAPAVTDLLKALLIASDRATTASRLNGRVVQVALGLIARGLSKTTLTVVRYVGVNDHLFHGISVLMNIDAKFNPLPTAKATTGTLTLLVMLSNIGQPVTITVPTVQTVNSLGQLGSTVFNGSGLSSGPLGSLLGK